MENFSQTMQVGKLFSNQVLNTSDVEQLIPRKIFTNNKPDPREDQEYVAKAGYGILIKFRLQVDPD